jgi:hypothetical protein
MGVSNYLCTQYSPQSITFIGVFTAQGDASRHPQPDSSGLSHDDGTRHSPRCPRPQPLRQSPPPISSCACSSPRRRCRCGWPDSQHLPFSGSCSGSHGQCHRRSRCFAPSSNAPKCTSKTVICISLVKKQQTQQLVAPSCCLRLKRRLILLLVPIIESADRKRRQGKLHALVVF